MVRSVEEARRVLQMPMLGVIQRITTSAELAHMRRRRMRLAMGWSATVLIMIGGVVIGMVYYREPLAQQIQSLRGIIGHW